MNTLPASLIAHLRAAGLTVIVISGWLDRERPGSFNPVGILNHHTGASASGWTLIKELAYAKWMFLVGRPDLPAPLCQIALGRSGTVYIGAAGRANHAGVAKRSGSVAAGDGNALYYGIEWMLSGTEAIPADMMESGVTLNAVISEKTTGNSVNTISAHYQTSVTGKWDIGDPNGVAFNGSKVLDMDKFRRSVQAERERLYHGRPLTKRLRVAMVNVPHKVGRENWIECWTKAAKRGAIFGINESLRSDQRATYAEQMNQFKRDLGQYGLHQSPNPIFWRTSRFTRIAGDVHEIHPKAAIKAERERPGFYAARYITEVVLRQRSDGQEIAVLNGHFASAAKFVDQKWAAKVQREAKKVLRALVKKHQKAGRVVIFLGDTNMGKPFRMPRGFKWIKGVGIDKIGSTNPGEADLFDAPTDHEHGVRATIRL